MNTDKHRSGSMLKVLRPIEPRRKDWNIPRKLSVSICIHLWTISLCLFVFTDRTSAQIRPIYDQGALGLGRLLKRLNTSASVLMIGAHPDDEDTALLSYLARGENARTAYLSLTRGDGGQNIIGPELGEVLGVIRTEELLQARKLDGAEQYFTRAYDYGFSKTLDEAKRKWDEKIVLCDVVQVIRRFRPLVVVSQFSGTSADGHGQHQYSGYISPLAVRAAADANQCTQTGNVWQVRKFYMRHRGAGEPTLRINTGKFDPLIGRSYFEIAMEARSQHKSQEQGVLELKGDQFSSLNLVESKVPKIEKESGIFDGIDTTWNGTPKTLNGDKIVSEYTKRQLASIQRAVERALKEYDPNNPHRILPLLIEGKKAVTELQQSYFPERPTDEQRREAEVRQSNESGLGWAVTDNREKFFAAVKLAANIQIDALAGRETIAPGDELSITVRVFHPADSKIVVKHINVGATCRSYYKSVCNEIRLTKTDEPKAADARPVRREAASAAAYFTATANAQLRPTQPDWLEYERKSDLFESGIDDPTLPFQRQLFNASVILEIDGAEFSYEQPVQYRYADDVRGEIRRNIDAVHALSVSLDRNLIILPVTGKTRKRRVVATVTSNSAKPISGRVSVDMSGSDRDVVPSSAAFMLNENGAKAVFNFDITFDADMDVKDHIVRAIASSNNWHHTDEIKLIAYPHIDTHRIYRKAEAKVLLMDLKTPPVKIGYIAGSGDRVPEAITQIGLNVQMIGEAELASGDLAKYEVIVVGIRASEVRPDFAANNQRLLDWVKNGGTMIVQYQRPLYAQQNLTPFPAQMGPRVSDENAKVTILQPMHPIFNTPNKITEADFEGWVQERNLYNFSMMDEKYTGLLESHDEGEAENKGGLVVADIGKGKYVYCSYSLFRQLPAGVPGAYRLLANLLSFRSVKGKKA